MLDPFVFLAPVLLLPVVALLRFVGCAAIIGLDDVAYTGTDTVTVIPDKHILEPGEETRCRAIANWNANVSIGWSASVGGFSPIPNKPNSEITYKAPAPFSVPLVTITATADKNGKAVPGTTGINLIPGAPPPPPPPPPTRTPLVRVNCGDATVSIPDPDGRLAWQTDTGFSGGAPERPTGTVTGALPIYNTARAGRDFTYEFIGLTPSVPHFVTLKFAEIAPRPGGRVFRLSFTRGVATRLPGPIDISSAAGGDFKTFDDHYTVTPDAAGGVAIRFERVSDNALVNAIEIAK